MKMDVKAKYKRALNALDRAGGNRLTAALLDGYAEAARIIRDQAKATTAFSDRTGAARRSFKVSRHRTRFLHAKLTNTTVHSLFLERKPLASEFMSGAGASTGPEQLAAVRKAVARHLQSLRKGL